ncbi:MAG TPA: hypothetical protein VFP56_00380 [Candidatus Limnocylindrales bacterium]|nr:hypothetical protein [Candidatus Limnocylindrales bacterium]
MTAIVLPDIDKATIDELRKKLPDLREIELPDMPKMKDVGKTAEETIDRLLGRSKAPVWPWVAAGIGLVALVGAVAAYFAWWRRPSWDTPSEPWAASTAADDESTTVPTSDYKGTDYETKGSGLTAAESSLSSTSYNPQEG